MIRTLGGPGPPPRRDRPSPRHPVGVAPSSLYQRVGGDTFFEMLTRRFYASLRDDPLLGALYPDDEAAFEAARVNLRDFLVQFSGGPTTYGDRRGHPRLGARHAQFRITRAARDAWVRHMLAALSASEAGAMETAQLTSYFESAASHLVNAADD